MSWLDKIPLLALVIAALALGLAPLSPEPHLWEKIKMLVNGTLIQPIDIFDLLMHASLPLLLVIRLIRQALSGKKSGQSA
ncbi:MAG: RND transporter [Gammaproteobacteria bacterium]|nr:RND transporter [Gammaproteobacteria bacterium]MDH3370341.1 RND transporter [Gammaproteobacteria bacterium]MDH3406136.1 RND transporter [Gammaproteobacteria bacterium]MDH3562395.1 RND transporter [Gammaproteobacteria bacterium]MDH5487378.1 RND transporter [Gammaproteobacteria bacterium]